MNAKTKTLSILSVAAGVAILAGLLTKSQSLAVKHGPTTPTPTQPQPKQDAPGTIQIALLLDTSGSMSGLINQTRTYMWKIVNEVSVAERNGVKPRIEIALYEYGKPSLGAHTGFIRQIAPLTADLDRVSEQLFALTTDGGDEYAGHAIQTATRGLEWSDRPGDLKLIFIAGNEDFAQGSVDYRDAIAEAREAGITVNTVYCGDADDVVRTSWQHGATLAHGRSIHIDHNQAIVHIAAPQDADIARLGALLNDTYIGYGGYGLSNMYRQSAQDENARDSGSMVARSVSKASELYSNGNGYWDLVDGTADGTVSLEGLAEDDLPSEMRNMSKAEREGYVKGKRERRKQLQAEIKALNEARLAFVANKRRELARTGQNSLDTAIITMLHEQAGDKGYTFP